MSEYLRRTRSVNFGPVAATVDYGEQRAHARITVTVLAFTSEQRRSWRRSVERLGIVVTEVDAAGDGCFTRHGKRVGERKPRTVSYSCQGERATLEELVGLPIVQTWNQSEASVPYRCAGAGPEKRVVRRDRIATLRQYQQEKVPVVL